MERIQSFPFFRVVAATAMPPSAGFPSIFPCPGTTPDRESLARHTYRDLPFSYSFAAEAGLPVLGCLAFALSHLERSFFPNEHLG